MKSNRMHKLSKKYMWFVLAVFICLILQCGFGNVMVFAEEPNTENISDRYQSSTLPNKELPEAFPDDNTGPMEQRAPGMAENQHLPGNIKNTAPIQTRVQQANLFSDNITLIVSLLLLALSFVFVKLYKRKNY